MLANTYGQLHKYKNETGAFENDLKVVTETKLTKGIKRLDEYILMEIYKINNGLEDVTTKPEYLNKLRELMKHSFDTDLYLCALATSKYMPKQWLLQEAIENKSLAFALFQRDDLTKKEVIALSKFIKPAEFREFLSDKNSVIHPNNVDILCTSTTTNLRLWQYRCFSKVSDECEIMGNLSTILYNCKDPELLTTAIIDNPNLSDKLKKKVYDVNGCRIECINHPPHSILKDIYPSIADTIFDTTLTNDRTITFKAEQAMGRLLENRALSGGMLSDFISRINSDPDNRKYWGGLDWSITLTGDSYAITNAIKLNTPESTISLLKSRHIDTSHIDDISPSIDFYMANKKEEKQRLFLQGIMDTFESLKDCDYRTCMQYILNEDEVAIKTMLISPVTSKDIMNEIKNYIDNLSKYEDANSYQLLYDLRNTLKDANPLSRQYFGFKVLQHQMRKRPIESTMGDPNFITTKLFNKILNYINDDEMLVGSFDTIHTLAEVNKLLDKYKKEGKDTKDLEYLSKYLYGYKEYRAFIEIKHHLLNADMIDRKFHLDIELLYQKYMNDKQFEEDFFKLPYETKKIFLQQLSKELASNNSKKYPYANLEDKLNIMVGMENFYCKLVHEIERDEIRGLKKEKEEKEVEEER